jgi:hypothetical protein
MSCVWFGVCDVDDAGVDGRFRMCSFAGGGVGKFESGT